MQSKLSVQILRSSSSGNCTAFWDNRSALIIDAGIPKSIISNFSQNLKTKLKGAIITHAHSDHLKNAALGYLIDENIQIFFANQTVKNYYLNKLPNLTKANGNINYFESKKYMKIDNFYIKHFPLEHDSVGGCFGFNIFWKGKKISFAADLCTTPNHLLEAFLDSDIIIIESNHDTEMLKKSTRHYLLKKRIAERAHLSNEKCSSFIENVIKNSGHMPKHIVLTHISSQCNTYKKALSTINNMLLKNSINGINTITSFKDRSSIILDL